MDDNKKSLGARIGEGAFCVIYLCFVLFEAIYSSYMMKKYNDIMDISGRPLIEFRYAFCFFLALLLGFGDMFHLIPRIIICIKESIPKQDFLLGLGNLISSITMTLFYCMLIKIGDTLEYHENEYNYAIEKALLVLAAIRILILILPMNKWYTREGNRKWAIIRNIPFVIMGILTVVGFIRVIGYADFMPIAFYINIIVAVILSFSFYLPVAINGKKNPKLGMLMIPKTLCYMWMLGVMAFWPL